MPAGRPSKYKPEYCQMLIEHMAKGYLYESFAGVVETCWDTLYDWEVAHPEFLEAKKEGLAKAMLHDEQLCETGIVGTKFLTDKNGKKVNININPTLLIFRLKNRYPKQYRDRQIVVHSEDENYPDVV